VSGEAPRFILDAGRHGAGRRHLALGALAVTRFHVDRAHRVREQQDLEPRLARIEHGVQHAVVGREPSHQEALQPQLLQARGEPGVLERGIRIGFLHRRLADDDRVAGQRQTGCKLRAGSAGNAVLRPRAALGAERAMVAWMPVAAREHPQPLAMGERKIAIQRWHHLIPPLDPEIPAGQEVRLHVHDQQGIVPVQVNAHRGAPL
jgi:hypothetical protein